MFKLFPVIALTLSLTPATSAQAGAAKWGSDLHLVAETLVPAQSGSGTMSLCHHVDIASILFVPVYTRVQGYALSNDGCAGDAYRDLDAAQFTQLQATGMIFPDLPATPRSNLISVLWGHAWLIIGGSALVLMAISSVMGRRKSKTVTPDPLAIHSLVAMSQVAVADGRIDEAELHQIASILTRLTGQSYGPGQVTDMLNKLDPSPSDLAQVGNDLSDKDRQIVLEAALNIAVADGEIHPNEYAVVSELAQRMRIGADQFRDALARISAHLRTLQPA